MTGLRASAATFTSRVGIGRQRPVMRSRGNGRAQPSNARKASLRKPSLTFFAAYPARATAFDSAPTRMLALITRQSSSAACWDVRSTPPGCGNASVMGRSLMARAASSTMSGSASCRNTGDFRKLHAAHHEQGRHAHGARIGLGCFEQARPCPPSRASPMTPAWRRKTSWSAFSRNIASSGATASGCRVCPGFARRKNARANLDRSSKFVNPANAFAIRSSPRTFAVCARTSSSLSARSGRVGSSESFNDRPIWPKPQMACSRASGLVFFLATRLNASIYLRPSSSLRKARDPPFQIALPAARAGRDAQAKLPIPGDRFSIPSAMNFLVSSTTGLFDQVRIIHAVDAALPGLRPAAHPIGDVQSGRRG